MNLPLHSECPPSWALALHVLLMSELLFLSNLNAFEAARLDTSYSPPPRSSEAPGRLGCASCCFSPLATLNWASLLYLYPYVNSFPWPQ